MADIYQFPKPATPAKAGAKRQLTAKAAENAELRAARYEIPDGHTRSLYLVVQPSGAKSWAVRYRFKGKPRKLTLGPCDKTMTLKEARDATVEALRTVRQGKDPAAEKRAAKHDLFETAVEEFLADVKPRYRTNSWLQAQYILRGEAMDAWRAHSLAHIEKADVRKLLDAIVKRGSPMMANRTFEMLVRFFNWCLSHDLLERSPCERLERPLKKEKDRERVLSDTELVAVWRACEQIGYPFGPCVQMLMLTGQRRDEVARATWDEFDEGLERWTLPRERVKNKQTHEVPLSDAVTKLLKALPRVSDKWVFSSTGNTAIRNYDRRKKQLDKLCGVRGWTLHDLRRTMVTGMARLGVRLEVIEKTVNHLSGSLAGIVGIYQRHSFAAEKREALERWAQYVQMLIAP